MQKQLFPISCCCRCLCLGDCLNVLVFLHENEPAKITQLKTESALLHWFWPVALHCLLVCKQQRPQKHSSYSDCTLSLSSFQPMTLTRIITDPSTILMFLTDPSFHLIFLSCVWTCLNPRKESFVVVVRHQAAK